MGRESRSKSESLFGKKNLRLFESFCDAARRLMILERKYVFKEDNIP